MHDRSLKIVGIGVVAAVVISTAVMLLWNALLPDIFGIKSIGFFQALGLLILCKVLFGGIGGRGWFGRHGREMRERWMAMSPEQRDTFIRQRGFGHGFRHGPGFGHGRGGCGHHGRDGRNDRDPQRDPQQYDDPRAPHDAHGETSAARDKQE